MMTESRDAIINTLGEDSILWEAKSLQASNKGIILNDKVVNDSIDEIYKTHTHDAQDKVTLDSLLNISVTLSNQTKDYQHCQYQSALASIIVSYTDPFLIVVSPTGSGKTWI